MTTRTRIILLCGLLWLGTSQSGWSFYNPTTGRWLSRDSIQEDGGFNLYGFLSNNPIDRWDYLGEQCCLITYPRGTYTTSTGEEHSSVGGHSVLKCDNGTYISFWPRKKGEVGLGSQWHDEKQDEDYYKGPKPDKTCLDCLDENKVKEWLDTAKSTDKWKWGNNCSDATANAIISALPQPQNKPTCPCSSNRDLEYVAGSRGQAIDWCIDFFPSGR